MSQDPVQPVLGAVKRRFGPYDIQKFGKLLQASVGAADIGKVHVDCKFLFKKSQWGTLDDQKAGIIYLDLTFSQPGDCRLSSATIEVTLDDEDKHLPQKSLSVGATSPVQIRTYGPREMLGSPRYQAVETRNNLSPEVEIGSIAGVGGIGHESVKKMVREHWWKFHGHLVAPGQTRPGIYKVLQWHVTENELQPQPLHSNTVHTAFSFVHDCQPFFMHVKIEGKLRRKTSHIWHKVKSKAKHLKFSQSSLYTTTLISFKSSDTFVKPLDDIEKCLDQDMKNHNMIQLSVLPEVQGPAAFESQPLASIQQPLIESPGDELQILEEEEDPEAPTIDELMSHSSKLELPPPTPTPDVSTSVPYKDTQGESQGEETPRPNDLQRQLQHY
ncbi:hypothetical protein NUW58_g214 [Xylaria curta]|uniref:Uncharacterized protein n=1 Tax=Xylaria curta TaxID=42375 RepID=A0ACC1PS32_9PEZI|nr:hypothetical protein NUW58_g214 [Xylaria curta]